MARSIAPYVLRRRDALAGSAALAAAPLLRAAQAAAPKGKMPVDQYQAYDGLGLAELIAKGEIEPRELLEAAITRLEATNPKVNCIAAKLYDHGRRQVADGLPRGPFTGVPFLLKDLSVALAGTVTGSGSKFFQDDMAGVDTTTVVRYKRAGLVIFGKTTTPELGLTGTTESIPHGLTRNPWNLDLTVGGSSGGAGAAVAVGIVPMANASDGAGSIRTPASCCGVFGLKPSRARVPLGPLRLEGWNGLGTVHAVSRSVRDNAALLDATAGPDVGDPYAALPPARPFVQEVGADPGKLRIALMLKPTSGAAVSAECLAAARDAAKLCESLGHIVEEAQPPIDHAATNAGVFTTLGVATVQQLEARSARAGRPVTEADVEPVTWYFYQEGKKATGVAYANARAAFDQAGRAMAEFLQTYDVILSPTLAKPPVKLGLLSLSPANFDDYVKEVTTFGPFTALANICGQPAMSVPLHWSADGLPIGVMFAGRIGDEATLYRLAGQLETARPWFNRRPPI
ncbi:MAG: amidase [Rhodospirillaceae bacterium]|nr:amidase [Rhodospirillaceae bacterium]